MKCGDTMWTADRRLRCRRARIYVRPAAPTPNLNNATKTEQSKRPKAKIAFVVSLFELQFNLDLAPRQARFNYIEHLFKGLKRKKELDSRAFQEHREC